ncbi:MAG TPA: NADH-quinone oxidoreductase subunit C [Phycisphaerae bacterium]|nr:NADH-quinone oxidoreductase subunit C [Phycisphaerae bacterium]
MPIDHPAAARLKEKFPTLGLKGSHFRGDTQIILPPASLVEVVTFLKNDPGLNYNMLSDVSCVDYLNYPGAPRDGRYGLVYIFNSIPAQGGEGTPRLILRVFLQDGAELEVDSLVPLYAGAEWLEREVYDMFGIKFRGHPDLRRILTWDGFKAHPLRKDYPVTGKGEREQYPVLTRDSA